MTFEDSPVSGSNVIRVYTATDICGNSATFEQIISIPPSKDDEDDEDDEDDDDDEDDEDEDDEDDEDEDDEDDEDDDEDDEDDDECEEQRLVAICHVLGNGQSITIHVAQPAVQAHLNHGDTLGPCTENFSNPVMHGVELREKPNGRGFQKIVRNCKH